MNIDKLKQNLLLPQFYLMAIAFGFAIIHLILTYQSNRNSDELIFTALPWLGVLILLRQKKDQVSLESDYLSTIIGFSLMSLVLAKSVSLFWFEASFIKVIPLVAIIGLFLVFSGIKGLKYYWREIIVLIILAIPSDSLERIINHVFIVNVLTAKIATLFLWYSGIQVSNEGAMIYFKDASVFVDYPCTGVKAILILLKLSILAICVFKHKWKVSTILIAVSIVIGFVLGVIRSSFLSLIVKDEILFNYWHGDDGGSIFATISMMVFALIYNFIIPKLEGQKSVNEYRIEKS